MIERKETGRGIGGEGYRMTGNMEFNIARVRVGLIKASIFCYSI